MSSMFPHDPAEIADASVGTTGDANLSIETPNAAEVWDRNINFTSTTMPNFTKTANIGPPSGTLSRTVALGDVYQAVLYGQGQGQASGSGKILGKVSIPCLKIRGGRQSFLTQCAERPQLEITTGERFSASISLLPFRSELVSRSASYHRKSAPWGSPVLGIPMM